MSVETSADRAGESPVGAAAPERAGSSALAETAEAGQIIDIDVSTEMEKSFLEYAYSVIYARALPDARDGLKPVQRRILYTMSEMGLRPDRPHVKSSRVVGDVMGKLHPHGDAAIYDAMVRMAQDFSLRLPLVDGHGNFGSLDDGPAAMRYTEARMAASSLAMTAGLDEDVVEFGPNYDASQTQPDVLPAAIPNLLVNGASGIAVGMATNIAPHNLGEVIAAARHLLEYPDATLEDLMAFIPGPDLPTGGYIIDTEGIVEAYRTGRGTFRTRATAEIENLTARKKGIVVTELPYLVGPEKVVDKIAEGVKSHKIVGVTNVQDLTDRKHGTRLVIEVKAGFDPHAVLEQLYRTTPLEDSFGINNVALVDGQPRTLGLVEMLQVWVAHRVEVVRRRTAYRLARRQERLHLVEGLLLAIADIDQVIAIIRASDDAAAARSELMSVFSLSEEQANYILDLQLRRLTRFSRLELQAERDDLAAQIADLKEILDSPARLRGEVSAEMAATGAEFATPRRTRLPQPVAAVDDDGGDGALELPGIPAPRASRGRKAAPISLEIADAPTQVVLTANGRLTRVPFAGGFDGRASGPAQPPREVASGGRVETTPQANPSHNPLPRSKPDLAVRSVVAATTRSHVGLVTSAGRMLRLSVLELPDSEHAVSAVEFADLGPDEEALAVVSLAPDAPTLALGTVEGVVKRVAAGDVPNKGEDWEVISLKPRDRVIGAAPVLDGDELVFVSSDASLLHFSAKAVRPQGRAAGGMAGIKLAPGAQVVFFGVAPAAVRPDLDVITVAGSTAQLDGLGGTSIKVSPYELYPGKGRATGGVRSHRFLKGEDVLVKAWVGERPARLFDERGKSVRLPEPNPRRDGSGTPLANPIAQIA